VVLGYLVIYDSPEYTSLHYLGIALEIIVEVILVGYAGQNNSIFLFPNIT